jgi:tRNA wybutosine-synthesizing protein 4
MGLALRILQIKPYDAFGRQMCSNLESRGCALRGVTQTPTLEAHCQ